MSKIPQVETDAQALAVCEFMSWERTSVSMTNYTLRFNWKRIKSTAKAQIRAICEEES